MFTNGDRIVVTEGHEHAGREGKFLYHGNTSFTAGKSRVVLDPVGRKRTTTSAFVETQFITMATPKKAATEEITAAAAAPEKETKARKQKVKRTFGKTTEVRVISGDSPYHEMVGTILTGVLDSKNGTYEVRFPDPTGVQPVHANDLDLEEGAGTFHYNENGVCINPEIEFTFSGSTLKKCIVSVSSSEAGWHAGWDYKIGDKGSGAGCRKAFAFPTRAEAIGDIAGYIVRAIDKEVAEESLKLSTAEKAAIGELRGLALAAPIKQAPAPQAPGTELPLNQITRDTMQPRHHFDETALQELADSITEHGVLQAIVVRPNPFLISKDEFPYCIVFGERRYRAAQLAGLQTIPAVVRELTEIQALELQIIENLQRKDVHPMEEGIAFKRLMDGGCDIEALRLKIGVSTKYIATRIKLTDLFAQWQKAFLDGKIDFGQAVRLSKIESKAQSMLYRDAAKNGDIRIWDGTINEALRNTEHTLDKAPFKTEDPTLNPEMGACSTCPFNTSNTPRLFMGEERICTNSACYGIKEKNSYKKKLEKAAKDPDIIFLDNSFYKSDAEKKKVEAVKEMGVILLGKDDILRAPKDPGPIPVWEEYLANAKKEFDENFEEGDDPFVEADCREEFEDELLWWQEESADYERSLQPGAVRKAFVVVGNDAGKYIDVLLKADNPEVTDKKGTSGIIDIELREKRAKELDAVKIFKELLPLYDEQLQAFKASNEPLTKEEKGALAAVLLDMCSWSYGGEIKRQLNAHGGQQLYSALNDLEQGAFNLLVRNALYHKLRNSTNADSYPRNERAVALVEITRQYLPKEVKEIELRQQEKATKRQKRVDERIAELKAAQEKEEPNEES